MGGSPYRAVLRGAERVWHDLRFKDLYRSGKEFELMHRAMGFAALAILTVIPLLIVVAAANPAPQPGLAVWVVYGMGLTGSSADAVTLLFSAPARVLGTTSVFGVLVLSVSGVALAGATLVGGAVGAAGFCGAGVAGFAACPQATAVKSNKHNHPR